MEKVYEIGGKKFALDEDKAVRAFEDKRVINGTQTMYFNILPLKYQWAYELYKTMKANHWEPEEISLQKDNDHWLDHGGFINDADRSIVKMAVAYFLSSEDVLGESHLLGFRAAVTAPELKLVLGRHAHEENIHSDGLVYLLNAFAINGHLIEADFKNLKSTQQKTAFVNANESVPDSDADFTQLLVKQQLAKNIFFFGQCVQGIQFYGLFALIFSLGRNNKFLGLCQIFKNKIRDEACNIKILKNLLSSLVEENPEIWTPAFKSELVKLMKEARDIEKDFVREIFASNDFDLNLDSVEAYIDFTADARLEDAGLETLLDGSSNPLPWLGELMELQREGVELENVGSLNQTNVNDDDL